MRLIAELSMPNSGSWNGKWSGERDKYTVLFSTSKKLTHLIGSYSYNFGDGWCACVTIREAEPREKVTNRFAGYNWMVNSIRLYGTIEWRKGL